VPGAPSGAHPQVPGVAQPSGAHTQVQPGQTQVQPGGNFPGFGPATQSFPADNPPPYQPYQSQATTYGSPPAQGQPEAQQYGQPAYGQYGQPAAPAFEEPPAGAPPAPQAGNRKLKLVLILVAVFVVLAGVATAVTLALGNTGDSLAVGNCVKQSGAKAVAASCSDGKAYRVVSKVTDPSKCPDTNQPFVQVSHKGSKDDVLCLRPATQK
jgi:hypothetical protein